MTHEEMLKQRNELLEKAETCKADSDVAGLENLIAEIDALDNKWAQIAEENANAQAMENVLPVMPEVAKIETSIEEETNKMEKIYNKSSVEYRNAWLKNLAVNPNGEFLIGAPTVEETNAYTHTTANTGSVVPTVVENRIVELVQSMAPMYADATKSALTSGFGVPRHAAIAAGDAAVTDEGAANSDEQDTFNLLSLPGVEIKKHIKITRKMQFQSVDAFEDWVVKHLAERIANAKEVQILSKLSNTTYGIAAANVLTSQTYDDAAIRSFFAKIACAGTKVIYANNKTIWNNLFGIQDDNGRALFIPSQMDDPIVAGRIYGAVVKQDENIADDTVYVGVPASILANDFDELTIAKDMDVTNFVTTVGGYSLFDAGLENPLAFVKASF